MLLLDERRHLLDVNGACVQLLGRSRDSLLGRPIYQFVVGWPDRLARGVGGRAGGRGVHR